MKATRTIANLISSINDPLDMLKLNAPDTRWSDFSKLEISL